MSAPTLYLMTAPSDGLAVRQLLAASTSDLPAIVTDDGDEPYAEAVTNRGTFKCAVGSIGFTAGYKNMKQLGPTGWEDM